MKDGEPDFSKYTAEQIERSLSRIDREKFPLNYANLLAAKQALPTLPTRAEIDARREAELARVMESGEVWLSARWTVLLNTLLPAIMCVPLLWLLKRFLLDGVGADYAIQLRQGATLPGYAILIVFALLLPLSAWWMSRMRRVVVRNGQLEARSQFRSVKVELRDIRIIRWNDTPDSDELRAALIELSVESALGRKIRFMPRSLENMRAFATHVAAVQGKAVADRAYKSLFSVGAADP